MPFSRHFLLLNAIFLLALVPPIHPAPSSYGGGQQQNQGSSYSNYGQYLGGGANGGGGYRSNSAGGVPISQVEYRVESDASRRRLNNGRHPNPNAALLDQRQQQKNLGSGMFREADFCQEKCEFDCQLQLFFSGRDNEPEELFYCAKLRPPPKAFHEKIVDGFNRAGIFEFIVGGVLAFSVLICCICSCYQCCCKGGRTAYMSRRHGAASFDDVENGGPNGSSGSGKGGAHSPLNGGGTLSTSGLSPEHESLTNSHIHQQMDDGIQAAPLPDKQRFPLGSINGGIHHGNHHQQHINHHSPHSHNANNFMPRSNTGGAFSSRTHSDV